MRLTRLVIKGFQSFGAEPTIVSLDQLTFLIGPNGSGKSAVLQALTRLFGFAPDLRRVRVSDFHRVRTGDAPIAPAELSIEAHFEYPELLDNEGLHPGVPDFFSHMVLKDGESLPELRVRLTASIDEDEQIEESLNYVTAIGEDGQADKLSAVSRHDRGRIQVHYLPARRDPSDQVRYNANSLFGRLLRSANWTAERAAIAELTGHLSAVLSGHVAVEGLGAHLAERWDFVHSGEYFRNPTVAFDASELDALLRHLTIRFGPAPEAAEADFGRLSDGQQSLLYVSLVLAVQTIGRKVLTGELTAFDVEKLRPPVFVLLAIEEPENSLSPHHLGRLLAEVTRFTEVNDAQAVLATHSPPLLRRVPPEQVRFLRLDSSRCSTVARIEMPDATDEAAKYVREAVLSYPELYFSRLVILGEGDSEEVVLPRLLSAHNVQLDHLSISVVPLGGRHVNHFWRLLRGLGIPHLTLLDLDAGRHQGGWGRIKYALDQYRRFVAADEITDARLEALHHWDSVVRPDSDVVGSEELEWLAQRGVFFSAPLDLDYSMLSAYPGGYALSDHDLLPPDDAAVTSVLGKSHGPIEQYTADELNLFDAYRERFKRGSKPAAHLEALGNLSDNELAACLPEVYRRLVDAVGIAMAGTTE